MKNCIFCQIIKKKLPADIVYENKDVICFLPKKIEVYGHTLIVPKKHFVNLYDIPPNILCELIKTAKKLTTGYKEKIGATGMNLMHASGKDAQQSVFHFHFHLLPRFKNDHLNTRPNLEEVKLDRKKLQKKLQVK